MTRKMYNSEEINPEAWNLLSELSGNKSFTLIDLLRYKEWAEYPFGTVTKMLTGRQAYERYTVLSTPTVNKVGGIQSWRGEIAANLIGPPNECWDEMLITRYPSINAFKQMVDDSEFQAIVFHRTAAVLGSRLYGSTSPLCPLFCIADKP